MLYCSYVWTICFGLGMGSVLHEMCTNIHDECILNIIRYFDACLVLMDPYSGYE